MNERFLSKAKRVDNGEWVIGYYYKECDNVYIIKDRQKESELNRNHPYKVIPDTICQCAGREVDKHPLSENDICKDSYGGLFKVVWRHDAWYFESLKESTWRYAKIREWFDDGVDIEIIGNIHDEQTTFAGVGCMAILDSLDEVSE